MVVKSLPPSSRKVPTTNSTSLAQITKLEQALLGPTYNPNPLLPLLALARHETAEVVHKAIWALHRVFIKLIEDGRVGGLHQSSGEGDGDEEEGSAKDEDEARKVRVWARERMMEYVEILGGLLRDIEPALRVRQSVCLTGLMADREQSSALPLLFSLLPPLSSSTLSPNQPSIHTQYFRLILRHLLHPTSSMRGATARTASSSTADKWEMKSANQVDELDGILPTDVLKTAMEEYWAKYDDLRWMFFREAP